MTLFDIFPWWTWLVGLLGLAGAIAFMLLLPALAVTAEKGAAAALVKILRTRLGLAVVVAAIALFVGHVHGALYVERKFDARIEQMKRDAETARLQRDAELTAASEKKYGSVIDQLKKNYGDLKKEAEDYANQHPAANGAVCQLGADALRLRQRRK